MPNCFTFSNTHILIGYDGCSTIGVINYSLIDYKSNTFKVVTKILANNREIKSIK